MHFTYEGLRRSLEIAARSAVQQAGIAIEQIVGARLVRLQTLPPSARCCWAWSRRAGPSRRKFAPNYGGRR